AGGSGADYGGDDAAAYLSNFIVSRVGNVQVLRAVERKPYRPRDLCASSGPTVTGRPSRSCSGEGRDDSGAIDTTDPCCVELGNVEVTGGVNCDTAGLIKRCACGLSTVGAECAD